MKPILLSPLQNPVCPPPERRAPARRDGKNQRNGPSRCSALQLFRGLLLCLLICSSGSVFAQSSPRFTITRGVIAGGGTTPSSSDRFQLSSTVAQPLAAVPGSEQFSIQGGFWIWPSPTFFAPAKTGDNFIVSFQTYPGNTYTVQFTDTLTPENWQSLPSVPGNGAVESVTNSAPGIARRFYRLIEQ
jgi:hypothetical protein